MTRILVKAASWALISIIYISIVFTTARSHAEDAGTNTRHIATEYISSLDKYEPILVWQTISRPYEIVGENPKIAESVSSYAKSRRNTFHLVQWPVTTQISIVEVNYATFSNDIFHLLENSHLLPSYKSFAYKAALSKDGCTAYKFIDRETWISVALIFVDQAKFGIGNEVETNSCVFGALDYVDGFPTKDTYFAYMSLPKEPARALILDAIYRCAAEGDNKSRQDETTMDGITPLPSLECVAAKIGQ